MLTWKILLMLILFPILSQPQLSLPSCFKLWKLGLSESGNKELCISYMWLEDEGHYVIAGQIHKMHPGNKAGEQGKGTGPGNKTLAVLIMIMTRIKFLIKENLTCFQKLLTIWFTAAKCWLGAWEWSYIGRTMAMAPSSNITACMFYVDSISNTITACSM